MSGHLAFEHTHRGGRPTRGERGTNRGPASRPRPANEPPGVAAHAGDRFRPRRLTTPNPAVSAPPATQPAPVGASYTPLTGGALTDRQRHGMTTDPGPMTAALESTVFPTGGANPPCTAPPAGFEHMVVPIVATQLRADVPSLTPSTAADPMAVADSAARAAMPIIHAHYAPHAPSRSAATFMSGVSVKATSYASAFTASDSAVGEFLAWYSGENDTLRNFLAPYCGITEAWWTAFTTTHRGSWWDGPPFSMIERAQIFDTYNTTVAGGGTVELGRAFETEEIPHTVVHEAMHLFEHGDLHDQVERMEDLRSSRDIFTEGFAEYLARGVREQVVNAMLAQVPPEITAAQGAVAKTIGGYDYYVNKAVELRDILYNHGQDGEEAIRRAFFLGEGWRFGLLDDPAGRSSPIESDRPLPGPVDVHFSSNDDSILDPALLDPIVAYVASRNVATIEVVGRTDSVGLAPDNITLGQERADAVQSQLIAAGIPASRITASSRGELDQIAGGRAANRRATVTVVDPRNEQASRIP